MRPSENIQQFAERVDRLCEHILEGVTRDGSPDVNAVIQLQEDAKDIAVGEYHKVSLEGIANVLR